MSTSPVVVTGMGMVTPLGADRLSGWQALLRGESAVGPVRRFDASAFPTTFAAEVPSLPGEDQAALKLRLVMDALEEALIGSGELPYAPERIGISMGSEAARPSLETVARRHRSGVVPTASELLANAADAPARALARRLGVTGPCTTISTACTSSAQAVGEGWQRLRRGEVDAMVVGGVDVLVGPLMLTGFSLLGALSTRNEDPQAASRPFDMDRDGFVLGEGAGVLVLEREEAARARGATPLVELAGYGCSCNAWRITDSPPDGRGAAAAMAGALEEARVAPEAVGYINAHGTSTGMNDPSEARGIQRVFGEHTSQVWVSSTKSMMGHLVAACGAVEAIITAQVLMEGQIPPTLNLDRPDPECDLRHVTETVSTQVDHAISNAFGFGGSNASLLFRSLDCAPR